MTPQRILVTGGTGFIGSHLVRRLASEGHELHIVHRPNGTPRGRGEPAAEARLWACDLADPERVAAYPHHWTWIGQFGRFLRIAADEGCRDVAFLGWVTRPSLWHIRPDWQALRLMPQLVQIFRGGDDQIRAEIVV